MALGYVDVTAKTLDNYVEFDSVFVLNPGDESGTARFSTVSLHAPSVHVELNSDVQITGEPEVDDSDWDFYSCGYSAQWRQGKANPVMHPSELIGGRLARDMIDDGGIYAVVEVTGLYPDDVDEADQEEPIGWVVCVLDNDDD